jgi:thymidine phosphorylase
VASIPLITASILSKKIAAGLGALVMDVKVGNGAFMESLERSEALANSIINTAVKAGVTTHVLITDMNEVLGTTAGNAVEIGESMRYLRNEHRDRRLDDVVIALSAEMLVAGEIELDRDAAKQRCDDAVTSGRAAEIFGRMTATLGGPADFVDNYQRYLPQAAVVRPVLAEGVLAEVDTRAVGNAIIELGGGRHEVGEELDLSVGFTDVAPIGASLDSDRPLAVVHAASDDAADAAEKNLLAACRFADEAPEPRPAICRIMTGSD